MPSRRFTVAVVASALALCCVVTLRINDESMKSESEVTVKQEHAGMVFDHDEDDEDSDDLSPEEQALISAARDHAATPPAPPAKAKAVLQKAPKQVAQPVSAPQYQEDSQDELSPMEKSLIASAESGFDESFKKPSKAGPANKKEAAAADSSSAKDARLIAAAQRSEDTVVPVQSAKAPKALKALRGAAKAARNTAPQALKFQVAAPARADADGLSAKDASLIAAAKHGEESGTAAREGRSSLQAAMAKITQTATSLAVASVHPTVHQAPPMPQARPVPAAPVPKAPAKLQTSAAQASDDFDAFLKAPHPEAKDLPDVHLQAGMHLVGVPPEATPELPLNQARKLVLGFDTTHRIASLHQAAHQNPDSPVAPLSGSPAPLAPTPLVTPAAMPAAPPALRAPAALQSDYAAMGLSKHAPPVAGKHAPAPVVAVATPPVVPKPAAPVAAPPSGAFAAKMAALDAKAEQMASKGETSTSPAAVRRAAEMRHSLMMKQHQLEMME